MKIVKLVAENVKRLHAVEITPEGTLITIGGKNGAGKSSVLDSIAYAMGGEKLVPAEPIRAGEAEARIVVDLGDLIVTRRFKRDIIHEESCATRLGPVPGDPEPHACNCRTSFGETKSTLVVTNKDGAKYPSPQAVLDKLLGRLTFDPLAFAREGETPEGRRRQADTLRRLVGLDTTAIEDRRKLAVAERAMKKKTHDIKEAQLLALKKYDGVPDVETPLADLVQEIKQAEELRTLADEAARAVADAERARSHFEGLCQTGYARLEALQRQLAEVQRDLDTHVEKFKEQDALLEARRMAAKAAANAVPDTQALRARLQETDATNAQVRANLRRAEAQAELDVLAADVRRMTEDITRADADKQAALEAAQFPVPGLGLSDDGVLFNGLPFAQAGSAEQTRVSVAIGIALNPKLQVLLIRNGNLLDNDSLAAVAAQAEAAGMQVWMEYVTTDGDGVSVMLEDGHAAS